MGKKENLVDYDRRRKDPARLSPTAWGAIVAVACSLLVIGVIMSLILPSHDFVMTAQFALISNLAVIVAVVIIIGALICVHRGLERISESNRRLTHRVDTIISAIDADDLRFESSGNISAREVPQITAQVQADEDAQPVEAQADENIQPAVAQAEDNTQISDTQTKLDAVAEEEFYDEDEEFYDDEEPYDEGESSDKDEELTPQVSLGDTQRVVINPEDARMLQYFTAEQITADTVALDTSQVRALTSGINVQTPEESLAIQLLRESGMLDADDKPELTTGALEFGSELAFNDSNLKLTVEEQPESASLDLDATAATQVDIATTADTQANLSKIVDLEHWKSESAEERQQRLRCEIGEICLNVDIDTFERILKMAGCDSYYDLKTPYKNILRYQSDANNAKTKREEPPQYRRA